MLRLLLSRRWLARHALLLLALTVFAALGRWQWVRGEEGNARSFGYAFEWPLFAAFAVFWWARTIRLDLRPPAEQADAAEPAQPLASAVRSPAPRPVAQDEDPDPELAEYNRYLAWLHQQDQRPAR